MLFELQLGYLYFAMQIYLDYNASSPLMPPARAAVVEGLDLLNASSVHAFGRAARSAVSHARSALADYLGVRMAQIIFTSGATEALVTALRGTPTSHYLISAVEHEAVQATAASPQIIPVDANGIVDLKQLEANLKAATGPTLVAVQFANNETGVIQSITDIIHLAKKYGAMTLVDAVQAVGRIDLAPMKDADMRVIAAHKMGGPRGAAALVLRDGLSITPLLTGGGQEERRRAGTENVAAIAGFGAAIEHISVSLNKQKELGIWRDAMERGIADALPQVKFFGQHAPRLSNTSMLALPDVKASTQLMNLDLAGIAVSSGAACSSGKVAPSHVLLAMGATPDVAESAIRVSTGWQTTAEDFAAFTKNYIEMARRLMA